MLQLYSDAGAYEQTTIVTVLILKDGLTFVNLFSHKYEGLGGIAVGEALGVWMGLSWIRKNLPEESCVELFLDNQSVVQLLDKDFADTRKRDPLWRIIHLLCGAFEQVLVYHVKAHQFAHNPNKTCDMVCTALLRPYKKEKSCTL